VQRDRIRPRQQFLDTDELDAMGGCDLGGDVRIRAEELHLERAGTGCHGHADAPEADDPERAATQLDPEQLATLPLAPADGRIRGRNVPRHCEEERHRVLRRGHRVAGRRVDDGDACSGGRPDVDVVDADSRSPDDDELATRLDRLGVDLHLAADDQGLVLGEDAQELLAGESGALVDLVLGGEQGDPLGRELLGDEDPHALAGYPLTRQRGAAPL
jgi:hypothetical protein